MANLSDLTRKDQVLAVLQTHLGAWVDGSALANEQVGGSEGLKRLRELRAEGHLIQERPHPDRSRSIHQYRLVRQSTVEEVAPFSMPPREIPNGGDPGYQPHPQRPPAPQPVAPPQQDTSVGEWKRENATTKEYRREFWIREPNKQRVIGTVALDMDGSRWLWAVKMPAYKGLKGTKKDPGLGARPEKVLGHGTIEKPGGQGLLEAMAACERVFNQMKEQR